MVNFCRPLSHKSKYHPLSMVVPLKISENHVSIQSEDFTGKSRKPLNLLITYEMWNFSHNYSWDEWTMAIGILGENFTPLLPVFVDQLARGQTAVSFSHSRLKYFPKYIFKGKQTDSKRTNNKRKTIWFHAFGLTLPDRIARNVIYFQLLNFSNF